MKFATRILFLTAALSTTLGALALFALVGRLSYEIVTCDPDDFLGCGPTDEFWYVILTLDAIMGLMGLALLAVASFLWMGIVTRRRERGGQSPATPEREEDT
jgi:hypothetical protein